MYHRYAKKMFTTELSRKFADSGGWKASLSKETDTLSINAKQADWLVCGSFQFALQPNHQYLIGLRDKLRILRH